MQQRPSRDLATRGLTAARRRDGWLETFAESFTRVLPQAARQSYLEKVREATRPHLCGATGARTADYVRLRIAARMPDVAR